jgi:hypothetical protein
MSIPDRTRATIRTVSSVGRARHCDPFLPEIDVARMDKRARNFCLSIDWFRLQYNGTGCQEDRSFKWLGERSKTILVLNGQVCNPTST